MNWMVKYQSNNNGLLEMYFETCEEAVKWQDSHPGSELWERKYS